MSASNGCVPETTIQSASGGSFGRITGVEQADEERGQTIFGNYVAVPPGTTNLVYRWTSPNVAAKIGQDFQYTLTIQKQPGRLADPVAVAITIPPGSRIVDTSPEMTVAGTNVTLVTTLNRDIQISIRYRFEP